MLCALLSHISGAAAGGVSPEKKLNQLNLKLERCEKYQTYGAINNRWYNKHTDLSFKK